MKYLVNRKTKEHTVATREDMMLVKEFGLNSDVFALVEADSEGWIDHVGSECPLSDDVKFQARRRDGELAAEVTSWAQGHGNRTITHYRPILTEKVQEPEPIPAPQYDPRSVSFNLLERLKAAHAQAQQIPDLEAELREVLGSMGYDLVARSPFVEPEAAVEPDMSDWRNWREGDVLECVNADGHVSLASGNLVTVRQVQFTNGTIMFCHPDGFEGVALTRRFRFHSRPAKGEK